MNLSKQIFAYIRITRPLNVLITFFVVVVSILITQSHQTDIFIIFLASLSAAFTAAAGNIINDIYDVKTDKVSHPNRVLVLGVITKNEAWFLYLATNFISVFMVANLSWILLVIVFITIVMLFIYSAYLKKLPLIGNLVIAAITGLAFIYGGFAANNPNAAIVPAVFAFLINLIREMVKDIQDMDGDSKLNYKTFPIWFGIDKSKWLILLISIVLIGFTFYPFVTQLYKVEYFIIIMVMVNPLLILCLKFLYDDKKEKNLALISKILKMNMVLGLIAIYLGK